ncbi:MFS transporter [Burkholderia oklahomensis]|uniref:MFS transporter n=1 Tax=Burkholderia oklahomensis TaxID=342113 RepID=UPI00016A7C01|nr:MFS transporter [Burkholderia oklahomensis]AOI47799.1 MFS transporter [Burkholderia oklahomensis C6786]KUY62988.1 MFS transporter [Burkholderia oklahomensis C6786]
MTVRVPDQLAAMFGISLAIMLIAVDQTVVVTALPAISRELGGLRWYSWIGTAYLLASVIALLGFGRVGDQVGRHLIVVVAIGWFTLSSALCGVANSIGMLAIMRFLQGVGEGMLLSSAFAVIADLFPDARERLKWQILVNAIYATATAVGPFLGGFLTQSYGWRAVFFINLPFGLVALWLTHRHLPRRSKSFPRMLERFDWPGIVLAGIVCAGLLLAIDRIATHGSDVWAAAILATCVALAWILLRWELASTYPVLPVAVFQANGLAVLLMLSWLGGFALFSLLFYLPLLLQSGLGLSPQAAGAVLTPFAIFMPLGSILNGRIIARMRDPKTVLKIGFFILAVANLAVVAGFPAMSTGMMTTMIALLGIAFGFTLPGLTIIGQQLAGPTLVGVATASLQALRTVGGLIGVAVTGGLISLHHPAVTSSGVSTLNGIGAAAQGSLPHAIRFGLAAVCMASVAGLLISSRVPTVSFDTASHG